MIAGAVAIQAPPQFAGAGEQTIVGVQVEPVGHGPLLPTVQGISGGRVCEVRQRPPQVSVCVQMEPVGQGFPPNVQVTVKGGGALVVVQLRASGTRVSRRTSCILMES